jgi:hypothetical protein
MIIRWDYVAMCVAMGILFTLEMFGVFGKHYVTITFIIRTYMPIWARAMVWGWLGWHFLIAK